MTPLRQQMDEAMVLRGFALRTRESYLACVVALPSTTAAHPTPSRPRNCKPTCCT